MKKSILAPVLTLGLMTAAAVAPNAVVAQTLPGAIIAVVNSDRILSECTACVAANAQLQAQRQQIQTRAEQLNAPLQTEAQAIQTALQAAGGNPDAALQQRIQTFQTNQQNATRELQPQQETFQRNVAFVRQQILQRLSPVVEQVMQQRGANLAVDTGATFAHAQAIEITDGVMTALNAALPSVSTTAPPPTQQPAATPPTEGR